MEIFSKPTQKPKEKRTIVENADIVKLLNKSDDELYKLLGVEKLKFNEKTEVYE